MTAARFDLNSRCYEIAEACSVIKLPCQQLANNGVTEDPFPQEHTEMGQGRAMICKLPSLQTESWFSGTRLFRDGFGVC